MAMRSKVARVILVSSVVLASGRAMAAPEPVRAGTPTHPRAVRMAEELRAAFPGANVYAHESRVTSLYGTTLGTGGSAEASAWSVLLGAATPMGVNVADLTPGSLAGDDAHERAMMHDLETGLPKFTAVSWRQERDGLAVLDADVIVLTRNTPQHQAVLVRNNLRELGDFHVSVAALDSANFGAAMDSAAQTVPGVGAFSAPQPVIFAGTPDEPATPTLALVFQGQIGTPGDPAFAKYRFVADARSGAILHTDDLIDHANLTGTVQGLATQGIKADICDSEVATPLPYIKVSVGSKSAFADAAGKFTITNAGTGNVTAQASLKGKYFSVNDAQTNTNPQSISQSVPVSSAATLTFNSANTSSVQRDGVNAYINANRVRDMIMTYAPAYPVISTQFDGGSGGIFPVNVNLNSTCNAYYDGASINFFMAGGGCPSTAYYDVVHHEYGHHVVQSGGSGQDQYGEGTGDTMGVLLSDQPILGYGFQSNCNAGIRTASNTIKYPCSGEIHACGQLISGCWWETRNAMVNAGLSNYKDILRSLAINAVALHRGGTITPQICVDALTLDDTDGNLSNGTPHSAQILAGFAAHNMTPAAISSVVWPSTLDPFHTSSVTVQTVSGVATAAPVLNYIGTNGILVSTTMIPGTGGAYTGVLPAVPCQQSINTWVTVNTNLGQQSDPPSAPAVPHAISSGSRATTFKDSAIYTWLPRNSTGASGFWTRATPAGTGAGAPLGDYDGDGVCLLTGTTGGVTNGWTSAMSPKLDAEGGDSSVLTYARWFSNSAGSAAPQNILLVEVSGDNGLTWQTLETVGPSGDESQGGWVSKQFDLPPEVRTSSFRLRFTASNYSASATVEAGVDAVQLNLVSCPTCLADFNGDGFVDFYDYTDFVTCFEGGACPAGKTADSNGDGFVDFYDFSDFVSVFEAGC